MTFEEANAYLESLGIDAMKKVAPSLERIEALCDLLDHPERAVPALHVAGTNGKTSTVRILSSLLAAAGLSVGTYTSPHLQTVRERLALNATPLAEEEFAAVFDHLLPYVQHVEARLGQKLTYFEILTAMYFLWAAESAVDVSVVEVGLGGTWDATNVVPSKVAVVTNVALDHTALLGEDRVTIGREKAGIVKNGAAVVTGERSPDVLQVIRDAADGAGSLVSVLGRDFDLIENRVAFGGRYVSVQTTARTYEGLFVALHGAHQGANAALALEAITEFLPPATLGDDVVAHGLAEVKVPGRLEIVRDAGFECPVILDVAHNPDGVAALVASLLEGFAFERVVFVAGFLEDKDYPGMLAEMRRLPCRLLCTRPASERAVAAEEVDAAARALGLESVVAGNVAAALERARREVGAQDLVCVTGSHYLVGEARTHLLPSSLR